MKNNITKSATETVFTVALLFANKKHLQLQVNTNSHNSIAIEEILHLKEVVELGIRKQVSFDSNRAIKHNLVISTKSDLHTYNVFFPLSENN